MPDGKPLKQRKRQHKGLLSVWVPPALKRDVKRIAGYEDRPISRLCAGLLRLGIGRYFELADAAMIAPLRAAMRDVFEPEQWIPPEPRPSTEETRARTAAKLVPRPPKPPDIWDLAIEEGNRNYETCRG